MLVRSAFLLLLFCLSGAALSLDGPSAGLSFVPARHAKVMNAQLTWPLLQWQPDGDVMHLSLRGDASFALERVPPALGLALLLSSRNETDGIAEPYLGFGAGLTFQDAATRGSSWSLYGLTGLRIGSPQGAAAILELQLAGNRQLLVPSASFGFSWRFGAAQ
jgi:hypothetical protein